MTNNATNTEKGLPRLESVLSREPFKGLKGILDSLGSDREALFHGVHKANSYEELLQTLGYKVTVTKQIHVADCYSRIGPAGGIKPCFLITTSQHKAHCLLSSISILR